jgi:hypothetical protein
LRRWEPYRDSGSKTHLALQGKAPAAQLYQMLRDSQAEAGPLVWARNQRITPPEGFKYTIKIVGANADPRVGQGDRNLTIGSSRGI